MVPKRQSRLVEVEVEVVELNDLRTGPCVMGGQLCRIVTIDRTQRGGVVLKVILPDGTLDTQVYGSPSTPFLVLREEAVS